MSGHQIAVCLNGKMPVQASQWQQLQPWRRRTGSPKQKALQHLQGQLKPCHLQNQLQQKGRVQPSPACGARPLPRRPRRPLLSRQPLSLPSNRRPAQWMQKPSCALTSRYSSHFWVCKQQLEVHAQNGDQEAQDSPEVGPADRQSNSYALVCSFALGALCMIYPRITPHDTSMICRRLPAAVGRRTRRTSQLEDLSHPGKTPSQTATTKQKSPPLKSQQLLLQSQKRPAGSRPSI